MRAATLCAPLQSLSVRLAARHDYWGRRLGQRGAGAFAGWRPLSKLSLRFSYLLTGEDTWFFVYFNIIAHAAAAVTAFTLVLVLLGHAFGASG